MKTRNLRRKPPMNAENTDERKEKENHRDVLWFNRPSTGSSSVQVCGFFSSISYLYLLSPFIGAIRRPSAVPFFSFLISVHASASRKKETADRSRLRCVKTQIGTDNKQG
jgi:hypothetical protein